jgi:hypothetical protein
VQFLVGSLVAYALFTIIVWFYFKPHEEMLRALHYRQWGAILRRGKRGSDSPAK